MYQLDQLAALLDAHHADYEIIAHSRPIRTVQDGADFFDVSKAAPVLVLEVENGFMACIVSSQRGKMDWNALRQQLGGIRLRLAARDKVLQATGYHPGAVPLIGHGLPCIFDSKLLHHDYIYGGSGDELHTLKISPCDVLNLNEVAVLLEE